MKLPRMTEAEIRGVVEAYKKDTQRRVVLSHGRVHIKERR